jgi:hypothetical protein
MIFDFFKKPQSNVLPFPGPVPTVPYVEPEELETPSKTLYSIGVTDDNKMTLNMGYTTLTMTKAGCHNLIVQLEMFKNQLRDEE